MDSSSCTDVGGTTSTTESSSSQSPVILTKIPTSPPPPEHHQQQQHKNHQLYRVGSGGSVVLDSENGVEAESRKLPSSQYKGVVPQPNGRWGAQIYEKHQRVWLGTFNEEEEAAKAYDIAAQRFRGRDAITNFKPLSETGHDQEDEDDIIEAAFLNSHSKAEIVDMLRKHTYKDELQQSKRNYKNNNGGGGSNINSDFKRNNYRGAFMGGAEDMNGLMVKEFEHLFDKAVTPSDVGKLNRLVIPKQHAEKHFPLQIGSNCKGVLLNFEDNGGKVWRFRYSYWNSSQSYVLTKGWSRFVKEKNLKAGDSVTFLRSTTTRTGQDHKQLYIDWKARGSSGTSSTITSNISTTSNSMMMNRVVYPVKSVMITSSRPVQQPVQMVRLFGVNIFNFNNSPVSTTAAHEVVNCSKGKKRELELLSVESCCKKQCLAEAL